MGNICEAKPGTITTIQTTQSDAKQVCCAKQTAFVCIIPLLKNYSLLDKIHVIQVHMIISSELCIFCVRPHLQLSVVTGNMICPGYNTNTFLDL